MAISMNLMESWGPGSKVLEKLEMVKQRVSWKQKDISTQFGGVGSKWISFLGGGLWVGKRMEEEGLWMFEWEVALGGKVWEMKMFRGCLDPSNRVPSKIVGKLGVTWNFQGLFESQKSNIKMASPQAVPELSSITHLPFWEFFFPIHRHGLSWLVIKGGEKMVGSDRSVAGLGDWNLMFSRTLRVESTWTSLPWWWNDYWMV